MYFNLTTISAPSPNPFLPLALVKSQLRQDSTVDTLDDMLIGVYLNAAVRMAQSYTKTTLTTVQYRLVLDYLPTSTNSDKTSYFNFFYNYGSFRLPKPPLVSVDSISWSNSNGVVTTLPASSYTAVTGIPGRVGPVSGAFFANTFNNLFGGMMLGNVMIEYTAGYGQPDPVNGMLGTIPDNITAGILLLTCHLHNNREASTEGSMGILPYGVKELFDCASVGLYI